jgi:uncharacterized membrane protein YjjB (DUF3815 family)
LILVAIWVGLLLGLSLLDVSLPVSPPGRSVALWLDVLAAGVAAAAFGAFFSMPLRMLAWPVLVGMLAHAARWWAMTAFQVQVAPAAGLASLVVGIILVPVARRLRLPFAAIGFAAVVALIPGVFTFRLASGLIELQAQGANVPSLIVDTLPAGMTAVLVVMAMTLGLAVPKRLYDKFRSYHVAQQWARARPASHRRSDPECCEHRRRKIRRLAQLGGRHGRRNGLADIRRTIHRARHRQPRGHGGRRSARRTAQPGFHACRSRIRDRRGCRQSAVQT